MRSTTILLNLFLIVGTVFGQSLSIGVVGGTHLTDGIAGGSFLPVEPGSHSIVGGAMIELYLTGRLSLELDGLYRGLRGRYRTGSSPFTIVTWNMPLLSKYRLAGADARIAPFIAAGPSLCFGQIAPHWGATAGAGIEARVGPLRISPQLRFTHWNISSSNSITAANQVEIVASFASVAKQARNPLGERAEIGILLGTNLTSDFRPQAFPVIICGGSPWSSASLLPE